MVLAGVETEMELESMEPLAEVENIREDVEVVYGSEWVVRVCEVS